MYICRFWPFEIASDDLYSLPNEIRVFSFARTWFFSKNRSKIDPSPSSFIGIDCRPSYSYLVKKKFRGMVKMFIFISIFVLTASRYHFCGWQPLTENHMCQISEICLCCCVVASHCCAVHISKILNNWNFLKI